MLDEKTFDYDNYIQERLKEIEDLDERRFAKKVLLDGLANIFTLSEERYQQLERRIRGELEMSANCVEIVTTITDIDSYDPIYEQLFPVCRTDTAKKKEETGTPDTITVYLAGTDKLCREFLEQKIMIGHYEDKDIKEDHRQEIHFEIKKCRRYEEALKNLYHLFRYNRIPWSTVHTGYLERFFDLIPTGELTGSIVLQWGKWEPYIWQNKVLLWNIQESRLETRQFMVPCIDSVYYEHTFILKDAGIGNYLIGANENIEDVRYEQNAVILKSKNEMLEDIQVYQVCNKSISGNTQKINPPEGYFPLLTNRKKDSFSGRYLYKTGNFLQTEAELRRKIEELSEGYPIQLLNYEILEKVEMPVLLADMNIFIKEEVFPMERRKILLFRFEHTGESNYLLESHIRYLLSGLQQEYFEYKCAGVID